MIRNFKFFNLFKEYFLIFLIFYFSIILLCDQNWEPTAETYKHWVSAKILENTWQFNNATGPLYTLYLLLFFKIDFPNSIIFEKFASVIFFCFSSFFLLKRFLPKYIILIFIISWLPYIWILESTSRLIAAGFISIYFYKYYSIQTDKVDFFPNLLLTSILFDKFAILFLVGHLLFFLIKKKKPNKANYKNFDQKNIVKIFLILLLFYSIAFKSNLKEANHASIDYPYSPVNLNDSSYNAVFFQVGTWRWIKRQFYLKNLENINEEKDLYKADWYFYKNKAFNNAEKFYQTIYLAPQELILNIFRNLKDCMDISSNLLFGYKQEPNRTITIVSIFLFMFSFLFLIIKNYRKNSIHAFFTLSFGTFLGVLALLPILFSHRYNIIFFPFFLIITIFIFPGLILILNIIKKRDNLKFLSKKFLFLNFLYIIIGSLCFLIQFNNNYILLFLLISLFLLIYLNCNFFIKNVTKIEKIYNESVPKSLSSINYLFIIFVSINVYLNNKIYFNKNQIINNNFEIHNFTKNREFLLNFLKKENLKDTYNLSIDPQFLTAFDIGSLEKSKSILYLPPFYDKEISSTLNNFDFILLPYHYFTGPFVEQSTQGYLRYKLYLENFLIEKLNNDQIVKIEIKNYGYVFLKKN